MPLNLKPLSDSKILVVDDDLLMRKVMGTILNDICNVDVLSDSTQVMDYCISGAPPDLILLDVHMPKINGLEVCKQLRELKAMNDVPIIFVTASVEVKSQNECWEAGGSDFISKPIAPSTLVHRVKAHLLNKARLEQLQKLTYKDSLTGLYNRHYLNEHSEAIVKQVKRLNESIGFLMLDLDFFKRFNDLYGHQAGDECLRDAADVIVESLKRPQDVAVRYGGEEFLIILPYADLAGLKHVAKNILLNIKKKNIKHAESPFEHVSFSIGGALSHNKSCEYSLEAMIKIADENLYEAKRLGRNQLVI